LSLAKYYSSGNQQLEQAAAMLFPCVAVYRSRVRNTVTTDFSGRIAIERSMRARMIVIPLEVCKLSLEVSPYGANIRTNHMVLISGNITDNLFGQ
jgi:hypothetical protein